MKTSRVKAFSLLRKLAALLLMIGAPISPILATKWVSSWSSAQLLVDPANALPEAARQDATLRQLVRVSIGGTHIRVHISNAFGKTPLEMSGVDVALAASPTSSAIIPSSDRRLTFSGQRSVIVPAGAEYLSDPVSLNVPPLGTLAISIHYAKLPQAETGHPGSRATSYFAAGDAVARAAILGTSNIEHWYFISGVDVEAANPAAAIAALGDSITDGHGVATNSNGRWTDVLAERLSRSPATRYLGVLNAGIGGNRVLEDGIGPNAVARFGRDVLASNGVRYVILLEGVNDLGVLTRDKPASADQHRQMVASIVAAYRQMIERAHDHGIKMLGATIMPYGASGYYHPDAANEADRQAINSWIRSPGHFDAVIDFDALMRDPKQPNRLRKDYDSGDGLHPSAAGYHAMGEGIPLSLFSGARR
ncbi:MAG TPA: SGNH/GDSL hydrolase family protein [Sphingomicrobium sp.]|nr:SGNH/GDSL hydrolase family protein [Sphingomicrobium sp.]